MLLRQLRDLSFRDDADAPPILYSLLPVRYLIELDARGRPTTAKLTDTADPSNKATRRGERHLVPNVVRSSGVRPLLLADKASYVLGLGGSSDPVLTRREAKTERVDKEHQAFLEQVRNCHAFTRDEAVAAVLCFLESDPLEALIFEDFDPEAKISFRVTGDFVVDRAGVRDFWASVNDPDTAGARRMQCLVCGRPDQPVLDRLQEKVKGIPGGQTSGTSLISANADAFLSYGLEASQIAPTCGDCARRFTTSLNGLLSDGTSRIIVGNTAYVAWTREPVEFDVLGSLRDPDASEVRALIQSVFTGGRGVSGPDETALFVAGLSASGGRAVVREWIDTTLPDVKRYLQAWFKGQEVVGSRGEEPRYHGLFALAGSLVRDASREIRPEMVRGMLRTALRGSPVPPELLRAAVRRAGVEGDVTAPRAAMIKLALSFQGTEEGGNEMVGLNESSPSTAYQCGRLLAVLEQAQEGAIQGIKNTVADRFFSSAATTPGAIFPRLLQGGTHHLAKLKRDKPGAWRAIQQRLEGVQGMIEEYPRTLSLHEQGRFALGYYHQRAHDRARARENARAKSERAQGDTTATDVDKETQQGGE